MENKGKSALASRKKLTKCGKYCIFSSIMASVQKYWKEILRIIDDIKYNKKIWGK